MCSPIGLSIQRREHGRESDLILQAPSRGSLVAVLGDISDPKQVGVRGN